MKITILCVGKIKEKFYRDAIAEYGKRLGRYCKLSFVEVADEKTDENASQAQIDLVKQKEGERLLAAMKDDGYCICLAIDGQAPDSVALSRKIERLGVEGKSHLYFVIGGSLGLSDDVLGRADYKLSFSKMTFPHQLMRVILLEQLYRSFRIMNHEPYHK
jgi:23S rRNA (pseudouridine1915-N3)-methyltransferase